jgi:hypothetical protein
MDGPKVIKPLPPMPPGLAALAGGFPGEDPNSNALVPFPPGLPGMGDMGMGGLGMGMGMGEGMEGVPSAAQQQAFASMLQQFGGAGGLGGSGRGEGVSSLLAGLPNAGPR